ncbi:hypothetical protein FHW88_005175 [Mucilaginibacter sp. SG538B]|uniref:hypothetical protein n=1 Tax=Mucilaginibacter sp. SG538B TaxID=2587021 RepID=UPI00159D28A1|nr:hypothetical protein [Mucilaginibacter sp. SG538B]NVM66857.1 hypothetical protein [Mucilaginibacter sp. SG538B]
MYTIGNNIYTLDGLTLEAREYSSKRFVDITSNRISPGGDRRLMQLLRNGEILRFVNPVRPKKRLFIRAQVLVKTRAINKFRDRLTSKPELPEYCLRGAAGCLDRYLSNSRGSDFQAGSEAIAETNTSNNYHFTIAGSYAGNLGKFINDIDISNEN